jgi:hypothetical protein
VVSVVVDTPERIRAGYAIADAVTQRTGLVTSEIVPAGEQRNSLTTARLEIE